MAHKSTKRQIKSAKFIKKQKLGGKLRLKIAQIERSSEKEAHDTIWPTSGMVDDSFHSWFQYMLKGPEIEADQDILKLHFDWNMLQEIISYQYTLISIKICVPPDCSTCHEIHVGFSFQMSTKMHINFFNDQQSYM